MVVQWKQHVHLFSRKVSIFLENDKILSAWAMKHGSSALRSCGLFTRAGFTMIYGSENRKVLPFFSANWFSKEWQHFWSCLSFGEECIPLNIGLYMISTMLMVTTCQKPHLKTDHGSLTILQCFRKLIYRFLITPGHITLTLGLRKNPWRKVTFLLRLSVLMQWSMIPASQGHVNWFAWKTPIT